MKRCPTSCVIMEIQVKSAIKYHSTFIRMTKIQNIYNTKCWQGCEILIAVGNVKWYSQFGKQFGSSLQTKNILAT